MKTKDSQIDKRMARAQGIHGRIREGKQSPGDVISLLLEMNAIKELRKKLPA